MPKLGLDFGFFRKICKKLKRRICSIFFFEKRKKRKMLNALEMPATTKSPTMDQHALWEGGSFDWGIFSGPFLANSQITNGFSHWQNPCILKNVKNWDYFFFSFFYLLRKNEKRKNPQKRKAKNFFFVSQVYYRGTVSFSIGYWHPQPLELLLFAKSDPSGQFFLFLLARSV